MSFGSIAPNQTLYINNLNEKLKKTGPTAAFSVFFYHHKIAKGFGMFNGGGLIYVCTVILQS